MVILKLEYSEPHLSERYYIMENHLRCDSYTTKTNSMSENYEFKFQEKDKNFKN